MNPFFNAMGGGNRQPNIVQQFQQFMNQMLSLIHISEPTRP